MASCAATNATFKLRVTDSGALSATATLTVTVNANTPPTLSYPSNPGTTYGTALSVTPLSGPSDNGTISSIVAQSITPSNPGGITVNSAGVVSVAGTVPAGMYTVTIRAVDDCGGASGTTDASFTLGIAKATPVITWSNPANITYGTPLSATQLNARPTTAGTYDFTIQATKANSACVSVRNYTIVIAPSVLPLAECIRNNGNGTFTASFGYDNSTGAVVTLPVGLHNSFTVSAANRNQPTVFQVGRVTTAFTVVFQTNGSDTSSWQLKGPDGILRSALLLATSPPCP